ncbi:hypothetical protein Tsubulata_036852 [Turnera subulata]|uniref:Zinc finger LSD1-type domain-containing protein n=1 Tax=Turnera subulata TaxID=218843 RepID=A0A9Q0JFE1_9ROSI|nr:hypothetical protein Tsubulata_036852 [Turnera subulata]
MPTNSLTSSSSSSSSSSSASLRSTAHTNPVFTNVISSPAAQSQLVCSGCRTLLLFPVGATSVCCAVCNAMTAVPPPGTEMAQLVCGGCHNLLMHIRGATSVRCSCCHTVNLRLGANQVAHLSCGNCWRLLMYQYGARLGMVEFIYEKAIMTRPQPSQGGSSNARSHSQFSKHDDRRPYFFTFTGRARQPNHDDPRPNQKLCTSHSGEGKPLKSLIIIPNRQQGIPVILQKLVSPGDIRLSQKDLDLTIVTRRFSVDGAVASSDDMVSWGKKALLIGGKTDPATDRISVWSFDTETECCSIVEAKGDIPVSITLNQCRCYISLTNSKGKSGCFVSDVR